ncbi:hypothetical protein GQ55_4G104700 [Panicum hallii var. hallii]|uniref:Uncharacterized protein n=1 Tax=Panicum hallii var. hallii TaxID=1504633 RepID=A0A2T7DX88_9POAL|nr:hypothetical protein GQ55_4G104700 [Panicum hallii var. hallii]
MERWHLQDEVDLHDHFETKQRVQPGIPPLISLALPVVEPNIIHMFNILWYHTLDDMFKSRIPNLNTMTQGLLKD